MKTIEQKLVLFLADPKISDSEFSELARALESPRVQRLLAAAWEIRKQLDRDSRDYPSTESRDPDERALREIERLLLVEARIPKGVAVRMLAEKLEYQKPLPSRFSFHGAVLDFIHGFDASRVLSAAQRIRNEHVHERPSHTWPLGES